MSRMIPPTPVAAPWKWLDRARMIVTFDLERDRPAIADIDNTRVFLSCLHQNVRSGGGKFLQLFTRIFVRTVLTPHH